ncbi:MAG: alpha/beta hydrolase [Anaerolineaceae bacterium]|nr:alpha/beta hydrolase [Anaerolineaceae bacterium]
MEETLSGKLFVNSRQVGDYIEITMPKAEKKPEEQIRIHYLEAGIGEPLLLIHGLGQSLYTWRNLFAELSESYRVIAIDLPGHGYSDRPEYFCYSMDEMAEAIKLFLDEKEIISAHMIGFSTGAMYMLRLLTMYPEYVANCIAISPGGISKQMPSLIRSMKSPLKAVFTRNLFSFGDVKKCLQECFYDQTAIDDRVVNQYYEPLSDGYTREALMYAVQNFDLHYVTEQLKETDHEILLLWGKEDKWHLPNNSVFYQSILQNGRYFLVRNAGHIVQEDTPEKLYQVILSYIPSATYGYYPPQYFSYDKDTREQEVFDTGNEEHELEEDNQNKEPEVTAQADKNEEEMTSKEKEESKSEESSSEDKNDGEL